MDNYSFWTLLNKNDKDYHMDMLLNSNWQKCGEFRTDFSNPNGYKAKYWLMDYKYHIPHFLYLPNLSFAPMRHAFHLSSFWVLNNIRNIYSPQISDIPSLESLLIQSMSNVGIIYPGAIDLTKFDMDVNVKFKNILELKLVKEALLNLPLNNGIRKRKVFDTRDEFGLIFRSSAKKIGFSIYDKDVQMKSKYNYVNPEIENCLRFSYRINGASAMKNLFNVKALPFDALLTPSFNKEIMEGFSKRLNELGLFEGAIIVSKDKIKKDIKLVSNRSNKKCTSVNNLSKIIKGRKDISSKEKSVLKSKCKKNGLCFTWVNNDYGRKIYPYDLVMNELKDVLNGTSDFSYKDKHAT